MAAAGTTFLPLDRQLFDRTLGEAVAHLARQKYSSAKALARAWDIGLPTAENVWKGHCGARTLHNAIKCEGWAFLGPLGEAVCGESQLQYEERRITQIIEEATHARENLVRLRSRGEALERRAAGLVADPGRQGAESHG